MPPTIIMSSTVETIKAADSFMKPVNCFNLFYLPCATSDIIFNLKKSAKSEKET